MNRLRHKLILLYLAATLIPTAAILWTGMALLQHTLRYLSTDDMDRLSRSLEGIAREYYRQSCENLKKDATAGSLQPVRYDAAALGRAPAPIRQFGESRDLERFVLTEPDGDRLEYLVRRQGIIYAYAQNLNGVRMEELKRQFRRARARVNDMRQLDLRKGLTRALILVSMAIWVLALIGVVYLANRISQPIQDLTGGLQQLAEGNFAIRLQAGRRDEVGRAIGAFNHTAEHLQQNRERLVYLTQVASWQTLARKMAHELKNSLTPIRLTIEEIQARHPAENREFMDSAAQVVIEEVESLERRVRAFSEFAAEPAARPAPLDISALVEERIRFLEVAHPDVGYQVETSAEPAMVWADGDQIKGVLTNVLENAAEAAGPNGRVRALVLKGADTILVEVHDSGSGLSEEALRSLFEPSISFKERGMGLGLSIARKNALLAGGDLQHIEGALGGAGFRLILPAIRANKS